MKSVPTVSVNMPVYNGAAFIKASIQSVLDQTFADFELIIVNDGSTDDTVLMIEQFNDSRIRIVNNNQQTGLAHVRNKAINESAGKYIAILDSDDIAYPDRLQKQVDFLEENTAYSLVCGWADIIDADGNIIRKEGFSYSDKQIAAALFFHNCIAQSSVMLRKNRLPSQNPYDPAFPPAEDYYLWIQMAKNHPMHIIHQSLIKYRVHSANTSVQNQQHTNKIVSNILRMQLCELGLDHLSDEELQLQLSLVYNCYNGDRDFIIKLNKLYEQVIRTNRQCKRYSTVEFERLIKKYMYLPLSLFFVRKQYGLQELRDLFGHSVNAAFYLPAKDIVIILIKSIIRYIPGKVIRIKC